MIHVSEELVEMVEKSGLSKTDLVNRALSLYRLIMQKTDENCQLALVKPNGEIEIVHIL